MSITGKPIKALTPGSPEWLQTISASKVPAILGISPWQSKYSLWHLMAGNTEPWAGNKSTERGTYLEDAVYQWFQERHPELTVHASTSYAHEVHANWTAAPDGIAYTEDTTSGLEIKTSQYSDGWGTPGTAEIPPYYLAQVAWQMIVTGMERVYVPVLFGQPFEFREYVVNWEDIAADANTIMNEVRKFQKSLAAAEAPNVDESSSTYQTLRELHPQIDGTEVALPEDMALAFLEEKQLADHCVAALDLRKNQIAAYMGNAKKATLYGQPLFTRQAKGTGKPYLVIARTLPTTTEKSAAA